MTCTECGWDQLSNSTYKMPEDKMPENEKPDKMPENEKLDKMPEDKMTDNLYPNPYPRPHPDR